MLYHLSRCLQIVRMLCWKFKVYHLSVFDAFLGAFSGFSVQVLLLLASLRSSPGFPLQSRARTTTQTKSPQAIVLGLHKFSNFLNVIVREVEADAGYFVKLRQSKGVTRF